MKRSHWVIGSALTLALAAAASGCVVRARPAPVVVSAGVTVDGSSDYATVYPTTFAPEPIPEYRPAPPGYGYSWVDGYWDWTGYDWTWTGTSATTTPTERTTDGGRRAGPPRRSWAR